MDPFGVRRQRPSLWRSDDFDELLADALSALGAVPGKGADAPAEAPKHDKALTRPGPLGAMLQRVEPAPSFHVEEDSDGFLITMDVPGYRINSEEGEDDALRGVVDVAVLGAESDSPMLVITGQKAHSEETEEGVQVRRDISFRRMVRLPDGTKAESVEGGLVDGVLQVRVPKPPPPSVPKPKDLEGVRVPIGKKPVAKKGGLNNGNNNGGNAKSKEAHQPGLET